MQRITDIGRLIAQGGANNRAAKLLYARLVSRYLFEHGAMVTELRWAHASAVPTAV